MFDADLAKLYGVSTKALNQAFGVTNNGFRLTFVFQLSSTEYNDLKSQIVTSSARGIRFFEITICDVKNRAERIGADDHLHRKHWYEHEKRVKLTVDWFYSKIAA